MNDSIATLVRRNDPDRFLTALFAPPRRRDTLLTLYAFNHELARAREVASEPPLAIIRLQWWREVVLGDIKRHHIATPLTAELSGGALRRDDLLQLIEAREAEVYADFNSTSDWRNWVLAGAGGLAVAAAASLDAPRPEAARVFGAAYGITGLARASGYLASRGICLLPDEILSRHGLSREAFIADPATQSAQNVVREILEEANILLHAGGRHALPRSSIAAILPATLARRDIEHWPSLAWPRRFGDRLSVVLSAIRGGI